MRTDAAVRVKTDVDGAAHQVAERVADLLAVLVLEPLAGEGVGNADAIDVVLFGDDRGVFEPRVVVGFSESELQLAEGRVPELLQVQRLPFSALEHNDAPHNTITRDAATPNAKIRKDPPAGSHGTVAQSHC